ncbi:hypothetical protein BMR22_19670 [Escherichia marmotae]|nr:hypothetical protein BMR22_19670 [Escherichia marmotae]PGF83619.1 hypothetical protein BMR23_11510 [Escherichia marmotae]
MTNAKLPDALRLSGLRDLCNILNLCAFVGRTRRSRRIRHEQSALCQQSEAPSGAVPHSIYKIPNAEQTMESTNVTAINSTGCAFFTRNK